MSLESLTLPHLLAWRPAASPARCWRGQLLPATLCPVVPEQDRERASHPEEQAAHLQQPSASTSWGRGVPCGPLSSRRRGERPLLLGLYPGLRQGTEVAVLQGLKQRAHVPGQRPAAAGPAPSLPALQEGFQMPAAGQAGLVLPSPGGAQPWGGPPPSARCDPGVARAGAPRLSVPPGPLCLSPRCSCAWNSLPGSGSVWCAEPAPTQDGAQRAGVEPQAFGRLAPGPACSAEPVSSG